jgi:aminoglycoside 2''-phosphotransferase
MRLMISNLPPLTWRERSAPALSSLDWLGEGDFCACYLVNGSHVLRLAKHREASEALRCEQLLLPLLKAHMQTRIPEIEGAGTRNDTGEEFIYYPLITGTILGPEVLAACTAACRSALVEEMAGFVSRLQGFPLAAARACGLREKNPCQYLPELMKRAGRSLANHLPPVIWQYYSQLVELYLKTPALHTYTPTLLHGDLSPEHLLGDVESCRLSGVIDFGDSFIGDPYWELIYILEDYGEEILELFLTFYDSSAARRDAARRVRLFQQLNNVDYGMERLADGEPSELAMAIETLVMQATTQSILK